MPLPAVDSGTTLLTTAGYLCLLIAVIFLAYWLLKRFGLSGGLASGKNAPRLMSRLMLGNRQCVSVVRYRGRDLLLGVTDHQITLLSDNEAEEADEEPPARSFASLLKRNTSDAS